MAVEGYGDWGMVVAWAVLFGLFILFTPFNRKVQRKPSSIYLAFVVALAFEMFGAPLSIYFLTWTFGLQQPLMYEAGHTLYQYIGLTGMYVGSTLNIVGALLVVLGWAKVHKIYWSRDEGSATLVTKGVYRYMRHPQYTGFILITLGFLIHWATIPILLMWPILVALYYRLAKREETEMERKFGRTYQDYKRSVPMFIPNPFVRRR